jgi:mRNA interferase MazF
VVTRGDICWANLSDAGRRPVVILTRPEAIPVLSRLLAAPVTKTVRGIPTEVRLGEEDGMSDECVISLDNLRLVPRAELDAPIGSLGGKRMREVCRALAIATGCDWRVSLG